MNFHRVAAAMLMSVVLLCSFQCGSDITPVLPPAGSDEPEIPEVPVENPNPEIVVKMTNLIVYPPSVGRSSMMGFSVSNIAPDGKVEVLCPDGGLDLSLEECDGEHMYMITVRPHDDFSGRSEIVITATNGDKKEMSTVEAELAFVEPLNPSIWVKKTAGEYEMPVRSNVGFQAECDVDWITVTCDASNVCLSVTENETSMKKEAVIVISDSEGLISSELSVIQYVDGQRKDRAALTAIYNALGGPEWNDSRGWCTDAPLNEWTGVFTRNVEGEQRVQYLHIRCQNAVGEIPDEIGDLDYVSELWIIQEPGVTGVIPQSIAKLERLADLRIAMTSISGGIPDSFSEMKSLRKLSLYDNFLTGSLPLWLAEMPKLESFGFEGNCLNGEVDESLTLTPWWTVMTQDTQEPMGDAKMRIGQKYPYRLWKHGHENDDPTYYNQDDPANPLGPEDFIFD